MFCDFDSIFHPTTEQQRKDAKQFNNAIRKAYDDKLCETCEYCQALISDFPGTKNRYHFCTIHKRLATETCDRYKDNGLMGQHLINVKEE